MSPGQALIKGKAAISDMIESTSKIPGFKISWESLSVSFSKSGDMAYMIEQNKIIENDSLGNPIKDHNKVVTIWRKVTYGSWNRIIDMWNAIQSPEK